MKIPDNKTLDHDINKYLESLHDIKISTILNIISDFNHNNTF